MIQMKSNNNQKKKNNKKQRKAFNMFEWGQKYKKAFAGIICIILVISMILSILPF